MNEQETDFTRRTVVGALAALGLLPVVGCKPQGSDQQKEAQRTAAETTGAAPTVGEMTVYRDPSCGCCEAWAGLAKEAGYQVSVIDHPDMPAIKRQFGVPDELSSCHTAIVAGYAIEGHVPFEHVARLLETKPAEIKGIAVAGMPRGSPGMEMPDGSKDPFEVMAFDKAGRSTRFET
jgi:hypothetical protein